MRQPTVDFSLGAVLHSCCMRAFSIPSIRTSRLVLRPLDQADVAALYSIHSDPKAMRYWSAPIWKDEERGRTMIERDRDQNLTDHLRLGIELAAPGDLIGTCTLFDINDQCHRAELGYMLGSFAWGHGYT